MSAATSVPTVVAFDATAVHARSGGVARYVEQLLGHLPAAAGPVHVLLGRDAARAVQLPADARLLVHRVAPDARPARLLWEQTVLPQVLRRLTPPPAVLHSPHYTMPLRVGRVAHGRCPARVVTVHDLTVFTHPEQHDRAKVRLFRAAVRRAARAADALVCVSHTTADELHRLVEVRAPVEVIPHGVDTVRFTPTPANDDAAVLARLGVRPPYVLFVGTIEPRKNVAGVVRAYDAVAARRPELSLVLGGGRWPGTEVPTARHGSTNVLGFVADDDLPVLLRHAGAVLYPSFAEGFGLPVLEALASGAPVVTSDRSATAEVGRDAAILVDPHDVESIAAGLADALDGRGPALAARLARAARYRWDDAAAAHVALWERLSR